MLLRAWDAALSSGDREAYSRSRAALQNAKQDYNSTLRKTLGKTTPTTYGKASGTSQTINKPTTPPTQLTTPSRISSTHPRFEDSNNKGPAATITALSSPIRSDGFSWTSTVKRQLGPMVFQAWVLKACAAQLAAVFTSIFNLSLQQATVSTCLKATAVIPVPKTSAITNLNDYWLIALMAVIKKCFKRLVLASIKPWIPIPMIHTSLPADALMMPLR